MADIPECHMPNGDSAFQHARELDRRFRHPDGFPMRAADTGTCMNCGRIIDRAVYEAYCKLCRRHGLTPMNLLNFQSREEAARG